MKKQKTKSKLSNTETMKQTSHKYKLNEANLKMAFDLKSSAISLQNTRRKKALKKFTSKGQIRKALPLHYRTDCKLGVLKHLFNKDHSDSIKYAICSNGILLAMSPGSAWSFSGLYNIKVISGEINILGYSILDGKDCTVFSNELDGILDINCNSGKKLTEALKFNLVEHGVDPKVYKNLMKEYKKQPICLLMLSKSLSMFSRIMEKTGLSSYYMKMPGCPLSPAAREFHVTLNVRPLHKAANEIVCKLQIPKKWTEYADALEKNISKELCIVVCGGKSTGKSTMVRYLCNRLLSSQGVSYVACLDLDPIKPELSAPGNLSLSVFSDPLLGTASSNYYNVDFSFQQQIVFTHRNPSDCLSEYYAIAKLLRDVSRQFDVPLIVHTMGYSKCSQTDVIVNLLQQIRPSHVMQMHRDEDLNSFDVNLVPETVNSQLFAAKRDKLNYKYKKIAAVEVTAKPSGLSIEDLRAHNLLSYMASAPGISEPKNSMKRVEISSKDYAIHSMINELLPAYHIAACHMKLVALCQVNTKYIVRDGTCCKGLLPESSWNTEAKFHGYGFVLKIDLNKQKLTVLTSVKTALDATNAVVGIGFPIPNQFRQALFKHFLDADSSMKATCDFIANQKWGGFSLSAEEYNYVTDLIFSDCVNQKKEALQYLYIWKSRAPDVPIGIEITISLLEAEITLQDTTTKNELKRMLIHGDICRFINILCKSYNEDLLEDDPSMSSIFSLINICPVVAEYRNFLTHLSTCVDLEICQRLIATSMQWVKANYWHEKMGYLKAKFRKNSKKRLATEAKECDQNKKPKITKRDPSSQPNISPVKKGAVEATVGEFQYATLIKMTLDHYFSMKRVVRPAASTNVNFEFDGFMVTIMEKYVDHPEEVMNLIVEEVFLNPERFCNQKLKGKRCSCECLLSAKDVSYIAPVLAAFAYVGSNVSNHFLKTYMTKDTGSRRVFSRWLKLFVANIKGNSGCRAHRSAELSLFSNSVNWEKEVILLMQTMEENYLTIARSILLRLRGKMDHIKELMELLDILQMPYSKTEVDDTIYTVEMLAK